MAGFIPSTQRYYRRFLYYLLLLKLLHVSVVRPSSSRVNPSKYRCPRRNVPDFGMVFLMVKCTYITQNTYVQSWTVTEIMAREKCGLLAVLRIVPISWHALLVYVLECGVISPHTSSCELWEGVPYGKVYLYNPKHLCPKLNGYGDNGQRKVWSTCGSTHCTY
jgi:hypothetical protein